MCPPCSGSIAPPRARFDKCQTCSNSRGSARCQVGKLMWSTPRRSTRRPLRRSSSRHGRAASGRRPWRCSRRRSAAADRPRRRHRPGAAPPRPRASAGTGATGRCTSSGTRRPRTPTGRGSSPVRGAGPALERADDLRRDPAAVEGAVHRLHALAVDAARVERLWVEGEVAADRRRTPSCGVLVGPRRGGRDAVADDDVEVRGAGPSTRRTSGACSARGGPCGRRRAGSSTPAAGSSRARGGRASSGDDLAAVLDDELAGGRLEPAAAAGSPRRSPGQARARSVPAPRSDSMVRMATPANPLDDPDDAAALDVACASRSPMRSTERSPAGSQRCVERRAGRAVDDALRGRARGRGASGRDDGAPRVRQLLDTDVDAQRTGPLEILRSLVRYPTEVLRAEQRAAGRPRRVRRTRASPTTTTTSRPRRSPTWIRRCTSAASCGARPRPTSSSPVAAAKAAADADPTATVRLSDECRRSSASSGRSKRCQPASVIERGSKNRQPSGHANGAASAMSTRQRCTTSPRGGRAAWSSAGSPGARPSAQGYAQSTSARLRTMADRLGGDRRRRRRHGGGHAGPPARRRPRDRRPREGPLDELLGLRHPVPRRRRRRGGSSDLVVRTPAGVPRRAPHRRPHCATRRSAIDLDARQGRGPQPRARAARYRLGFDQPAHRHRRPPAAARPARHRPAVRPRRADPRRRRRTSSTTPAAVDCRRRRRGRRRLHRPRDGRGVRAPRRQGHARRGGARGHAHARPRHGALVEDAMRELRHRRAHRHRRRRASSRAWCTPPAAPIDADLVVLGLGVVPNSELAAEAGIETGVARTRSASTAASGPAHDGVWAAGDCCESFHLVSAPPVHVALGTVANKQGRVAGINIGGGYATFPGVVGTAVTKVCATEVGPHRPDRARGDAATASSYVAATIEAHDPGRLLPGRQADHGEAAGRAAARAGCSAPRSSARRARPSASTWSPPPSPPA